MKIKKELEEKIEEKLKTERIYWTRHVQNKMKYYGLSDKRVKKVMRNPDRKELGIAPLTIAVMEKTGTKKNPTEIWVMYQRVISGKKRKTKIISAWRYPGISPIQDYKKVIKDFYISYQENQKND